MDVYRHLQQYFILYCGLNLFDDYRRREKEFANNYNLVSGCLNSVWLLQFNSFYSRIEGTKQSYKYNGLSLLRIL